MTDKEEDIRFYSAYAQAVIAGLERLKNRTGSLTPSQEAELAVNKIALGVLQPPHIEFHVKRHPAPQCVPVSAVVVADPKAPSTWPKWEHAPDWSNAERRDCMICFAEGVATVHDPDDMPRCADCWEDLQPCVNCGNVSTRPGGEHYCNDKKKKDKRNDD